MFEEVCCRGCAGCSPPARGSGAADPPGTLPVSGKARGAWEGSGESARAPDCRCRAVSGLETPLNHGEPSVGSLPSSAPGAGGLPASGGSDGGGYRASGMGEGLEGAEGRGEEFGANCGKLLFFCLLWRGGQRSGKVYFVDLKLE